MGTQRNVKLGEFMADSSGVLHGSICGLGIGTTEVISEEATAQNGRRYLKLIADPMRSAYEVGVAFPKTKNDANYYSVHLDSPIFPFPLNAALFPDKGNEGTFNLVWTRPEAIAPVSEATATPGVQVYRHGGIAP